MLKDDLKPQKILIRSTNWIGDAIMTTPAVRTIRKNFPEAEISVLAYPWVADIFRNCPHVDKVVVFDKNEEHAGLKGLWKLSRQLRAKKFDLAILLQNAFLVYPQWFTPLLNRSVSSFKQHSICETLLQ